MHRTEEIEVCAMKAAEFREWIKSIEHMSRSQRNKLRERLEGKTSVDEVIIDLANK